MILSSRQLKRLYRSIPEPVRVRSGPVPTNLRGRPLPIQFIRERCRCLRVKAICTSGGRNQFPQCSDSQNLRVGHPTRSSSHRLSGSSISDSLPAPPRSEADRG